MKKILLYTTLTVVAAMPISSCNKFVDTQPYSTVSSDQFYQTASDAELAMVSCYNVLNAKSIQGASFSSQGGLYFMQVENMLSGSTDEAFARVTTTIDDTVVGQGSWDSNSTYIRQVWFFLYVGIERCNILLEKIDGIPGVTDARKLEIKGEARFLRGFYHMMLGMIYGGVPVNTTSNPDLKAPRVSVKDVFTQVIADLNFAYTNLPNRAGINGRANKWSAAGMLAKTYAFMGSCKANGTNTNLNFALNSFDWVDQTDSYTKVKTITDDIINNSGYKLTASYPNLFHETTKSYQDEECLFMAEGSTDPVNGNQINGQNIFIPQGANATNGGGVARIVPTGEMFNKYNANDTRRTNNLTGTLNASLNKETIDGAVYYAPAAAITAATIKANNMYYGGKFRMIDPATKSYTLNYWAGNYPILRLAEIYLLRAEAIFYTTGNVGVVTATAAAPAGSARADFSTVRARSILAANLQAANFGYYKTDFIQELLDERSRELCFEGIRHLDLTRFNRYISSLASITTDKSMSANNATYNLLQQNFTPNKIWFPVPATEIVLNPNLVQNPGY